MCLKKNNAQSQINKHNRNTPCRETAKTIIKENQKKNLAYSPSATTVNGIINTYIST